MNRTEKTEQLFKFWPDAAHFVEIAEANGFSVHETDRDVLTLRRGDQTATVGLKFRDLSQDLVLFACRVDGSETEYSLTPSSAAVLRDVQTGGSS